jgi:hypothetical protein
MGDEDQLSRALVDHRWEQMFYLTTLYVIDPT